jgi:hypothetical protein
VNISNKLDVLKDVSENDTAFDHVLEKLLEATLSDYRLRQKRYEQSLTAFEQRYEMTSEIFYRRFEAGELGDAMDFFEWSGLYELHRYMATKIQRLEQAL